MLETLSREQIELMNQIRDEWIGIALGRIPTDPSREDVLRYAKQFYGLIEAEIILCDSPFACSQVWNQVPNQMSNQLWNQVPNQMSNQLWNQLWNQVSNQVWNQVPNQVRNQLWNQLWRQVSNQVRSQVWNQVRNQVPVPNQAWFFGVAADAAFANVEFFLRAKVISDNESRDYVEFLKLGVWMAVFLEKTVVVMKCPISVKTDELHRMHSVSGPAIKWRDGQALYYIHGVNFDEELFQRVVRREITPEEIIGLPNSAQRSVACELYGYSGILAHLKAHRLDRLTVNSASGKELTYNLYSLQLGDDHGSRARFLEVECPSTNHKTMLRVEPAVRTCKEAVAWTFSCRPEEYELEMEA